MDNNDEVERMYQENQQRMQEDMEKYGDIDPSKMGNFKMPNIDELIKILNSMEGISDEDREQLRKDLIDRAQSGDFLFAKPGMDTSKTLGLHQPNYFYFFITITVICLIFAFFGYKLYKSLMEKERKRQEKKKGKGTKQQTKKPAKEQIKQSPKQSKKKN